MSLYIYAAIKIILLIILLTRFRHYIYYDGKYSVSY